MAPNLDQAQTGAHTVEVMVELDLIKDFLQFNKLVLNAPAAERNN